MDFIPKHNVFSTPTKPHVLNDWKGALYFEENSSRESDRFFIPTERITNYSPQLPSSNHVVCSEILISKIPNSPQREVEITEQLFYHDHVDKVKQNISYCDSLSGFIDYSRSEKVKKQFNASSTFCTTTDVNQNVRKCMPIYDTQRMYYVRPLEPAFGKTQNQFSYQIFQQEQFKEKAKKAEAAREWQAEIHKICKNSSVKTPTQATHNGIQSIQKKQTVEHFYLDSDPDGEQVPENHPFSRPGIIWEMYGGCPQAQQSEVSQSFLMKRLIKMCKKLTSKPPQSENSESNFIASLSKSDNINCVSQPNPSNEVHEKLSDPKINAFSDNKLPSRDENVIPVSGNSSDKTNVSKTSDGIDNLSEIMEIDTDEVEYSLLMTTENIQITESELNILLSDNVNPLLTAGLGYSVRQNDLACLRDGEELFENVIDAFISLIIKSRNIENAAYLNTHFIQHIGVQQQPDTGAYIIGPDGRYIYEFVIHQDQLQSISNNARYIYLPIHIHHHYFLLVIDTNENSIEVMDSLQITTERARVLHEVMDNVIYSLLIRYGVQRRWKVNINRNVPLQQNTYDCGAFVIRNADLSLNNPLQLTKKLELNEMQKLRKCIYGTFLKLRSKLIHLAKIVPNATSEKGATPPPTDFIWRSSLRPAFNVNPQTCEPAHTKTPTDKSNIETKASQSSFEHTREPTEPLKTSNVGDIEMKTLHAEHIKESRIPTENIAACTVGLESQSVKIKITKEQQQDKYPSCAVCKKLFPNTDRLNRKSEPVIENGMHPSPLELLNGISAWSPIKWSSSIDTVCRACYGKLKAINSSRLQMLITADALHKTKFLLTNGLFAELDLKKQPHGKCYHCHSISKPQSFLSTKIKRKNLKLKDMCLQLTRTQVRTVDENSGTDKLHICKHCRGQVERFHSALVNMNGLITQTFPQPLETPSTPKSNTKKKLSRSSSEKTPSGITPGKKRTDCRTRTTDTLDFCKCCGIMATDKYMYNQSTVIEESGNLMSLLEEVAKKHGFKCMNPSSELVCRRCFNYVRKVFLTTKFIETTKNNLKNYCKDSKHGGLLLYNQKTAIAFSECINCGCDKSLTSLTTITKAGVTVFALMEKIPDCITLTWGIDKTKLNDYHVCFACCFLIEQLCNYEKEIIAIWKEYSTTPAKKVSEPSTKKLDLSDCTEDANAFAKLNIEDSPSSDPTLNQPIIDGIAKCLRREANSFILHSGLNYPQLPSASDVENLDFDRLRELLLKECPLLNQFIRSLSGNMDQPLSTASIFLLCALIFESNKNFNLLQRLFGFIMWKEGLSAKMFALINHLHISMSMQAIRNLADHWLLECEMEVLKWKENYENEIKLLGNPIVRPVSRTLFGEQKVQSVSIAYDNINYNPEVRHQGPFATSKMVNWTIQVLFKNRIPSTYDAPGLVPLLPASPVAMDKFLVSQTELRIKNSAMVIMIQQILCRNFSYFRDNDFAKYVEKRKSIFPEASCSKTEYIPLGLSEENEGTILGNVKVLEELTKYIARIDDVPVDTVMHGDGATVTNMKGAIMIRATSIIKDKTLQHFFPIFGLFHKRAIGLDDVTSKFGIDSAIESPGSLGQLKRLMKIMGAESGKTFNHTYDLVNGTMEGLACLALMEELGLSSMGNTPNATPDLKNHEQCKQYLFSIANKVAEIITFEHKLLTPELMSCNCKKKIRNENVLRCSSPSCKIRPFFHKQCNPDCYKNEDEDFYFCSSDCERTSADRIGYYSRALLHASMAQVLRREAVRRNDIELMYIYDKEDLLSFFLGGHPKYVGYIHTLVLSQNGCVPKHIAQDIKNNRTINTQGKPDTNIGVDLFVEHNVADVKEDLRNMPGNLSHQAINRKTKLGRLFEYIRHRIFKATDTTTATASSRQRDLEKETIRFVNALKSHNLFSRRMGYRCHPGFENFSYRPEVNFETFKSTVMRLSQEWDENEELKAHYMKDDTTTSRLSEPPQFHGVQELQRMFSWDVEKIQAYQNRLWNEVVEAFPLVHVPNDIQFQIINSLMNENTVVILPTAMGKSLCFVGVGLMQFFKRKKMGTTVLVVSPLTSIIKDQCQALVEMGLRAEHLTDMNFSSISSTICEGGLTYVFASPETLATSTIRKEIMKWKCVLVAVDEAHLIRDWGKEFRPTLHQLGELRSIIHCPFGAFSATCSNDDLDHIKKVLRMSECNIFAAPPDRPNIFIAQRHSSDIPAFYKHLSSDIREFGTNSRKTIIYVDTYKELLKCQKRLMMDLKGYAYHGDTNSTKTCMIATYSTPHDDETKNFISEVVKNPNSLIRIIISTVSFGLGVDVPDIELVVSLSGSRANLAERWQQAGRAGRRSQPAIFLSFGPSPRVCLRQMYLMEFDLMYDNMIQPGFSFVRDECKGDCKTCMCDNCLCCDFCSPKCACTGKTDRIKILFPNWNLKVAKAKK